LSRDISRISAAHLVLLVRVEPVGRLVEDQHLRVVQDRLRQPDAARKPFDRVSIALFEHRLELQALRSRARAARGAQRRRAAHVGDEAEEAAHGHLAVARRALGQIAEQASRGERAAVCTSKPQTRALPEVGARKPASIFIVVDLPAPFGPRKPSTSPGSTRKLTSSTAGRAP
jgi:hypothetical protein